MPNYRPKGAENMRALAQLSVLKRAEVQRKKKAAAILRDHATTKKIELPPDPEPYKRPNLSGGSHDNDWPCPYCRRVNSIKRRSCAECGKTPANGRITKAARLAREKEHRTQGYLSKLGI